MANALANAMASGYERARNALADVRKRPGNALLDTTRGALMGVTTDVLGYPVDLATMAMRPFGYGVEQPVGGSDWLANRLTSPTGSPAEMAGRVATGMLTPGPEEMLRMAGMLPRKAPVNELITYHGSPHRINNVDAENPAGKFDLSKVGTGEGAQAYGHGIYLAENPDVAYEYQRMVKSDLHYRDVDKFEDSVISYLNQYDPSTARHAFKKDLQRSAEGGMFSQFKADEAKKLLSNYDSNFDRVARETDFSSGVPKYRGKELEEYSGHFYTVDLPDEHIAKMLDWDAPLSEQPELMAKLRQVDDPMIQEMLQPFELRNTTGAAVYMALARKGAGASMDGQIGQRKASENLRSLGIPGIKYFDGGSRSAGEGTRNFVIFDGDTAKILKRE